MKTIRCDILEHLNTALSRRRICPFCQKHCWKLGTRDSLATRPEQPIHVGSPPSNFPPGPSYSAWPFLVWLNTASQPRRWRAGRFHTEVAHSFPGNGWWESNSSSQSYSQFSLKPNLPLDDRANIWPYTAQLPGGSRSLQFQTLSCLQAAQVSALMQQPPPWSLLYLAVWLPSLSSSRTRVLNLSQFCDSPTWVSFTWPLTKRRRRGRKEGSPPTTFPSACSVLGCSSLAFSGNSQYLSPQHLYWVLPTAPWFTFYILIKWEMWF